MTVGNTYGDAKYTSSKFYNLPYKNVHPQNPSSGFGTLVPTR
jgi:hypothetical protein